jgi:chitinase
MSWYLRSYPIENTAKDLDYIVYTTYDLRGQWDYNNNNWTSSGYENGSSLRPHINETETMDPLSMVTENLLAYPRHTTYELSNVF